MRSCWYPPLFERDHKGRSRLAKSSYDFLFCKPNLRWLFNDYLPCGFKSLLHFSPPRGSTCERDGEAGAPMRKWGHSFRTVQIGSFKSGGCRGQRLL